MLWSYVYIFYGSTFFESKNRMNNKYSCRLMKPKNELINNNKRTIKKNNIESSR